MVQGCFETGFGVQKRAKRTVGGGYKKDFQMGRGTVGGGYKKDSEMAEKRSGVRSGGVQEKRGVQENRSGYGRGGGGVQES